MTRRALAALALTLASWLLSTWPAHAADAEKQLFTEGVSAIRRGAHDAAIDDFELLADRGFVHPDASYNRGVAYVARAASPDARPGDLGRATAAFEECALLRPGDEAVEHTLELVREEIARRRAREGASVLMVQKRLAVAVIELLDEDVWAGGALAGSFLLTLSLAALGGARKRAQRLTATTTAGVATLLLFTCTTLTAAARRHRLSTEPAVIVTNEARLLDETGAPLGAKNAKADVTSIPEGARVDVVARTASLVKVQWGTTDGWLTLGQLRVLERPR